jgi:hypothetical protein
MPEHASLYLNVANPENLPADWSCHVTFTLSVVNPATKEIVEKATFSKLFNRLDTRDKYAYFYICMIVFFHA